VTFEVGGPFHRVLCNNRGAKSFLCFLFLSHGVLVNKSKLVCWSFERGFFVQRNGHVIALDVASFGVLVPFSHGDFGGFVAFFSFGVPCAEVEHVALGAALISQAFATGARGELGLEAESVQLLDVLGHFLAARWSVGKLFQVPVLVVGYVRAELFYDLGATSAGSKLSTSHSPRSKSGKM